MNPHDLIRDVLAAERAYEDAKRLGWPAHTHGAICARGEAWKKLEAAFREETEAQSRYWSSFE